MPKIKVDLDEVMTFYPAKSRHDWSTLEEGEIEVTDEWLAEYNAAYRKYMDFREWLEHAYRHQEGLKPFIESPFQEKKE